jgi:uncharacterized protein YprB with RNaseH-like and TPR domain
MLDTVKQLISSTPDIPFSQYYQQYINDIQDQSLGFEVDDLNKADILSLDRLITKLYKEMMFKNKP